MTASEVLLLVVVGFVAGGFAGTMGVGGGIIMVPATISVLEVGQRTAQGTSLAVIVVTAAVATIVAARKGLLDAALARRVAPGSAIGAIAGAWLATEVVDEQVLRRLFGVLVLLTAARMLRHLVSQRDT